MQSTAQKETASNQCHPYTRDGSVEQSEDEDGDNMGIIDDTGITVSEAGVNKYVSEVILVDGRFLPANRM